MEITDVDRVYSCLQNGRGFAWPDTGTPDNMLDAAEFVRVLEKRQGFKICCPEEIAFHLGWISADELKTLGKPIAKSTHGKYLLRVASDTGTTPLSPQ